MDARPRRNDKADEVTYDNMKNLIKSDTYEFSRPAPRNGQRAHADGLQRVHDFRLVRPLEAFEQQTVVDRRDRQLGHCVVRVSAASARESCGLHRNESRAVENHAGSDHARRVRAVRGVLHGAGREAQLCVCGGMFVGGGVFHI